ncbi:MAG: ABC-2 family transporter protein [Patescibacteria group bacterium]|mgnify:CR=1 FL=1
MKKYLKLYGHTFRLAIMKNMAYPQDFIVWLIVDILWSVINLVFFKIILLSVPTISGWTFERLILPLGFIQILNAFIWGLMYGNMKEIPNDVNKGNLDLYLSKPANSQFLVSTRYLGLNLISSFLIGIFLVWYGLSINNVLSIFNVTIVLVATCASVIISYSIWFMIVTTSLWFSRLKNIAEVFPHSVDIARYPVDIFNPFMRFIFTFIIPFAILGFLPADIVLNKTSPWYIFGPVFMATVLLYLSHRFWNFALRHYSSASS